MLKADLGITISFLTESFTRVHCFSHMVIDYLAY